MRGKKRLKISDKGGGCSHGPRDEPQAQQPALFRNRHIWHNYLVNLTIKIAKGAGIHAILKCAALLGFNGQASNEKNPTTDDREENVVDTMAS